MNTNGRDMAGYDNGATNRDEDKSLHTLNL